MDDEDFEDLFAEVDMIADSSQESLTSAAANLVFDDGFNQAMERSASTVATSSHSQADMEHDHGHHDPQLEAQSDRAFAAPSEAWAVIEKIESVFERITDGLINQSDQIAVHLKTRPTPTALQANSTALQFPKSRQLCFPGKTAGEAWRFTVTIRLLGLIYEALRTGVVLSKRDLYYRDLALFGSQSVVDRYVDDIAFTFSVPRSKLNVTAAAKGLVAGAFRICRRDGSLVDAAGDKDGILVPPLRDILSVDLTPIKWILVLEKEATFRSIAASSFWDNILACGVIITGKGYPDIATRAFLHYLSIPSPQNGFASPVVYGLADCDPDGLAILSIYRNGSTALAHESDELRVPQLQWLGLRIEHMMDESLAHNGQGLLSLTARDRTRAVKMLERSVSSEDEEALLMCKALQTMLMLNAKAELQLLDAIPNGMTSLLESTLGPT